MVSKVREWSSSPHNVVRQPCIRCCSSIITYLLCEPGRTNTAFPAGAACANSPAASTSSPRIISISKLLSGVSVAGSQLRTPGTNHIGCRHIAGRFFSTIARASSSRRTGAVTCGISHRPTLLVSIPAANIREISSVVIPAMLAASDNVSRTAS